MATVEAPIPTQIRLHEGPFVNEPLTDFTREETARRMRAAIEKVRALLGREYDLVIGGQRIKDQRQDQVHQSGQALTGGWAASESRQGARGTGHASGAESFRQLEPDFV